MTTPLRPYTIKAFLRQNEGTFKILHKRDTTKTLHNEKITKTLQYKDTLKTLHNENTS